MLRIFCQINKVTIGYIHTYKIVITPIRNVAQYGISIFAEYAAKSLIYCE